MDMFGDIRRCRIMLCRLSAGPGPVCLESLERSETIITGMKVSEHKHLFKMKSDLKGKYAMHFMRGIKIH